MPTDLIVIDSDAPTDEAIDRAATALLRGKVIAIPTEARYALVADPFNLNAVSRVFAAKGREQARSLPLLVGDLMMAEELTAADAAVPKTLRKAFALLEAARAPAPSSKRAGVKGKAAKSESKQQGNLLAFLARAS